MDDGHGVPPWLGKPSPASPRPKKPTLSASYLPWPRPGRTGTWDPNPKKKLVDRQSFVNKTVNNMFCFPHITVWGSWFSLRARRSFRSRSRSAPPVTPHSSQRNSSHLTHSTTHHTTWHYNSSHRLSQHNSSHRAHRSTGAGFRVTGAVRRAFVWQTAARVVAASGGAAARVAAAGPRLAVVWQAQYTEPPGGAAAGALARRWLSCGRRITQSLLEELLRTWPPLARGWLWSYFFFTALTWLLKKRNFIAFCLETNEFLAIWNYFKSTWANYSNSGNAAEQTGIPQFNSTSLALRRDCSSCINLCRLRKKAAARPIRAKMSKIKISTTSSSWCLLRLGRRCWCWSWCWSWSWSWSRSWSRSWFWGWCGGCRRLRHMNGCPPLNTGGSSGTRGSRVVLMPKPIAGMQCRDQVPVRGVALPWEELGLCTAFLLWEIFVGSVLEFGMYALAGFAISVAAV